MLSQLGDNNPIPLGDHPMAMLNTPVTPEDHIQGNQHAVITLVEYGDYECPACGQAYAMVKKIQSHYGDKLRFVFRNFPLTEVHPHAEMAAETAEFAALHHHFWDMHDTLFEHQRTLDIAKLVEMADALNLPVNDLKDVMISHTFENRIRNDFLSGMHSGVSVTPTFFINGIRHDGAPDYASLVAAIDQITGF